MSAWRRAALECVPELRQKIEKAETLTYVWIELWLAFVEAYEEPKRDDLIAEIYHFAKWCLASKDLEVRSAVWIGFFEHLGSYAIEKGSRSLEVVKDMARHISVRQFGSVRVALGYFITAKQLEDLADRHRKEIPKWQKLSK